MKSYDIFVDRRLIQGDLIVVDLPLRNDIAAYDYIEIDAAVKRLLGEKALIFTEDAGGIALSSYLASGKSVGTQKTEKAEATFLVDAKASFSSSSMLGIDRNEIEFGAQAKEVSQKIERTVSGVGIGVDGSSPNAFATAKSVGSIGSMLLPGADATEIKQSFAKLTNDGDVAIIGVTLTPPFTTYFESAEDGTAVGADVKSLSHLIYSKLVRSEVGISVAPVDADLLFSLGKGSARIAIGVDIEPAVQFFPEVEEGKVDFVASAAPVLYMTCKPDPNGVALLNTVAVILRNFRTLAQTDEFGVLANMGDMSLDNIDYITVEE